MVYPRICPATFLDRPNRFVAHVELEGETVTVHVKNTGRCRELLVPGCRVYLAASDNPARKTPYDLVTVEKEREGKPPLLINMDSQAPNHIAAEYLPRSGLFPREARFRREVTHGSSRFDFAIDYTDSEGAPVTAYLEVKGCTLETEGVARFPDAPTERGVKHLRELTALARSGVPTYILFVVQMQEMSCIRPNDETHPAFGAALREAHAAGVKVLAVDCAVIPGQVVADKPIPVEL